MRVYHLAKYYPPMRGGIETHVWTLAHAQAERGLDVSVVCVNHIDRQGVDITRRSFGRSDFVEEWDGPVHVIRLRRTGGLARYDHCPRIRSQPWEIIRTTADIVHLHTPNPTMLILLARMRLPTPLVVGYHSDVVRQRMFALALRPIESLVLGGASRILAASPNYVAGSSVLQRYRDKVEVLPYGIHLYPFLSPAAHVLETAAAFQKQYGSPLWLCVGRLVYYKGYEIALRALQNTPGTLMIVGVGPLERRLKALAEQLGVADRVVWLGAASPSQLVAAYQAATAFWFPSNARSEAFGLVQVEAMASGCPVINTDIGGSGVPWVSQHEESGLTVPVNNAEKLAEAARSLAEDKGLRIRLARGAKRRAQELFDRKRMADDCLSLYERILQERSPVPMVASKAL